MAENADRESPSRVCIWNNEATFLHRRLLEMSQPAYGEHVGVDRYREVELGRLPFPDRLIIVLAKAHAELQYVTDSDLCAIYRRRAGTTQKALAELIGCTHTWVQQMESNKAKPTRLVEYWNENGERILGDDFTPLGAGRHLTRQEASRPLPPQQR